MHCSEIHKIALRQILVLLLIGVFLMPFTTGATETTSAQTATQYQESEAAQGLDSGESGDGGQGEQGDQDGDGGSKKEGDSEEEEEPDC